MKISKLESGIHGIVIDEKPAVVVRFGGGVGVVRGANNDGIGMLKLMSIEQTSIGTVDAKDINIKDNVFNTYLVFDNTKSIDIVMEALSEIKKKMETKNEADT